MYQAKRAKKLVLVLATFMPVTDGTEKALEQMPCTCYLVLFKDTKVDALLNLNNEINIITPIFTDKLVFFVQKINNKV